MASSQGKHMPKDTQIIVSIMKDLGITDYDQQVLNHLLEFNYRYTTLLLDDAKTFSNFAKKKNVDADDVKVAIQLAQDGIFCRPPPRDVLMAASREVNKIPLPPVKPASGLRIPHDRSNFLQTNYRLRNDLVSDCEKDKDIMGSVVYCIHHKEGCKWSDQLRRLKGHLQTCKYDALPCTNHCGAQIARILMDDHVRYTCIERVIKCEYCNGEMKGEAAGEEHSRTCPVEPIHCEAKCGVKIPRRMLAKHKVTECSKRLVPCRHCGRQFVADTINSHTTSCPRFPLTCPNRCEIVTVAREDLEHHIKHACHSMLTSCSFKDVGCRFKSLRGKQMDTHMEEASQQHLTLMCSMVTKQQQQIVSMKKVINNLAVNQSGTLIWKISDVLEKLEEGRHKLCGDGLELISSPFYTSQFGYKLQASVFLNGNGSGENTHVSVYIKILPGEFDALLKWSFSHSVSFTLFDQSEKPCNIVESFVPDPSWENFQRPSTQPDSLGFGFPKFVSHETII